MSNRKQHTHRIGEEKLQQIEKQRLQNWKGDNFQSTFVNVVAIFVAKEWK